MKILVLISHIISKAWLIHPKTQSLDKIKLFRALFKDLTKFMIFNELSNFFYFKDQLFLILLKYLIITQTQNVFKIRLKLNYEVILSKYQLGRLPQTHLTQATSFILFKDHLSLHLNLYMAHNAQVYCFMSFNKYFFQEPILTYLTIFL